ncbi:MAG: response regulator [Burkholderiales bacterium]|nr:response regulator [Burkholderiales bacterium]
MKARALVIEDEAVNALAVEHALSSFGCDVVGVASSGEEALDFAERERPELVVCDITLRGRMSGVECACHLLERGALALVFLTAHTSGHQTAEVARLHPGVPVVMKPFSIPGLQAAIENALSHPAGA